MASTKSLIALGLTDTAAHFSRRAWGRFSGSKLKLDWSMFREDINCLKKNIPIHVYHFISKNKSNKILSNCDKNFLNFTYTSSAFLSSIFPHTLLMSLAFSSLKLTLRNFQNYKVEKSLSLLIVQFSSTWIYLYSDEASWASIGTSFWNKSGPDTSGSLGLKVIPFTREAPRTKICTQ